MNPCSIVLSFLSLYLPQRSCRGLYWFHHVIPSVRPSVDKSYVVRKLELCFLESLKFLSAIYWWREENSFLFWRFSLLPFQSYWTWYDENRIFTLCRMITWVVFLRMFWNCISSLPVKRSIPFVFDDFHFCRSRVIGLDMMENRIFTLCRMITWVVFLRMFWNLSAAYRWREEGPFHFWSEQSVMFWLWK
jgi:hypothetical protein